MHRRPVWLLSALFVAAFVSCRGVDSPESTPPADASLRIGFGLAGSGASVGLEAVIRIIVEERLVNFGRDGRVLPNIIDRWTVSPDRRTWRLHLVPGIRFHDDSPFTSSILRDLLKTGLPGALGQGAANILSIESVDEATIVISLREPSNFLLDSLEILVEKPGSQRDPIGTGPFRLDNRREDEVVLTRFTGHRDPPALIDQIQLKQYGSFRSAWADMLRGQVDMLYEIGTDALDFLENSQTVNVFNYQRAYVHMLILNTHRRQLQSPAVRRALNAAIDRAALLSQVLHGLGEPATGPIWPLHWAYDESAPAISYKPEVLPPGIEFTCLVGDRSYERLALAVQQQLQEVGVTMHLQMMDSVAATVDRLTSGDFDAVLGDTASGPHLLRPYQFWSTNGMVNYGRFSSPVIDAAFEAIDRAADDDAYRKGVATLQRAFQDDPPAVFLAWSVRSRAVSTRFDVVEEAGRDILATMPRWRPLAPPGINSTN